MGWIALEFNTICRYFQPLFLHFIYPLPNSIESAKSSLLPVVDIVHSFDDHHRLIRVSVGGKQIGRMLIQRLDVDVFGIHLTN